MTHSIRVLNEARAVLFDHDDTLVGTIEPKWRQHRYIAKQYYDKDLSDEELRAAWGKPLGELICQLYGTRDVDQALAHTYKHFAEYPKTLFESTIPTLRQLKAAGKLLGIITSTTRHSLENDLLIHSFPEELIDYSQTADETPFHKPDPKVFKPAIAWLGQQDIVPNDAVYIGDSLLDFQASKGAGLQFIGVETGLVTSDVFAKVGAESISSLSTVLIKTR